MIRLSELVLPGHPDKVCDQIADAIVAECARAEADAYAQVEVGIWSDHVWLSGGLCTRAPLRRPLEEIVRRTLDEIGHRALARRCQVQSTVCQEVGDPSAWTGSVNDQAIVIGWAGYDPQTRFLPPEHFLAHELRVALTCAMKSGPLEGHGPDGKLLVRLREDSAGFHFEHLLATVQQRRDGDPLAFASALLGVLRAAYERLRRADRRWRAGWEQVETLVNPNGAFFNGGSEGDNGQTGRKLVMDYYGPRVPLGGGALSGKHISHIDRIGAYAAREAALHAVATGAEECLVRVAWAPNRPLPLDVSYQMEGSGARRPADWFEHEAMVARFSGGLDYRGLSQGAHFYDAAPWNDPTRVAVRNPCGDDSCDACVAVVQQPREVFDEKARSTRRLSG